MMENRKILNTSDLDGFDKVSHYESEMQNLDCMIFLILF